MSTPIQDSSGNISNATSTLIVPGGANSGSTGTINDSGYDILRKNFTMAIAGRNTDALLYALASGDDFNRTFAENVFNQLFTSTASGIYLNKIASSLGIEKNSNINTNDDNFRKLIINISNNKLTIQSLLQILEVYYGSESSRAHAISGIVNNAPSVGEPYNLTDGDTLQVNINGKNDYIITFNASDFLDITKATASEIANCINNIFLQNKSKAFAQSQLIPDINKNFVYIYSGALGLYGSVTITGGNAQNILQFGNLLSVPYITPTWTISKYPNSSSPEKLRFSSSPTVDLSSLVIGDYINIYGNEFLSANRGSYPITNISATWFEVDNLSGQAQVVSQTNSTDLLFFRPIKNTIQNQSRISSAHQTAPSQLNVTLPAVSPIVNRGLGIAAYVHNITSLGVSSASRDANGLVTITTSTLHGLSTGNQVIINGIANMSRGNGIKAISALNTTQFTYTTPEAKISQTGVVTNASVIPFKPVIETFKGPYVFNTKSGVGITNISSTTTQTLSQNNSYRQITLTDASQFPDQEGYLVFGFGTSIQTAPVRYLGKVSNTSILLDSTFNFPVTIPSGSDVTLLVQKGTYTPTNTATVGSFYVTGSADARISASNTIDNVAAGNISIEKTIQYPGDRGLGGEGFPTSGASKLSDAVYCWADDNTDSEIQIVRGS